MKPLKCFLIAASILTLSACVEVAGDGIDYEIIPDIQIECPAIYCTADSASVFVGFVSDTSTNCEEYFHSLNTSNYYQSFDGWGTTTTSISGPLNFGTVSSWSDFNGNALSQIPNGQYKACGHFDTNRNQKLDVGEFVGDLLFYPGNSPQVMDDWYNIFN